MEQNKETESELASAYKQKLLKDIFDFKLKDEDNDDCFKEIINNTELKSKINDLINSHSTDHSKDFELDFDNFISAFIEEINEAFPQDSKGLIQLKNKFKKRLSSLKIYLLLLEKHDKESFKEKENKEEIVAKRKLSLHRKKLLEKFLIYEIYKVMNPRRIAGETKINNFINNMITGGLKKAMKYEGGSKKDLAQYSPKLIKKLDKAHKNFRSKGIGGIQI